MHKIANLLNVQKIVTIHYYEVGKGFVFDGEYHDFWEMVYISDGRAGITAAAGTRLALC